MAARVLVTGASGFVAQHVILQLLEKGYAVRGTLRSLKRADEVRAVLAKHNPRAAEIEFVEADLSSDKGWAEAVGRLRVRPAHRLALPCNASQGRDGADPACARRRASRAEGGEGGRREARGDDIVDGGDRLRSWRQARRGFGRDHVVEPGRPGQHALHKIEDDRRACGVGLREWRRQRGSNWR